MLLLLLAGRDATTVEVLNRTEHVLAEAVLFEEGRRCGSDQVSDPVEPDQDLAITVPHRRGAWVLETAWSDELWLCTSFEVDEVEKYGFNVLDGMLSTEPEGCSCLGG